MKKFKKVWDRIPPEACSGDEEISTPDGELTMIIEPSWRSEEVRLWFRAFDALNTAFRFRDGYPKRGNWPKYRIQTNASRKDTTHRLIPHLPRNFYDDTWFQALNDMDRQRLDAQEELNLTFPSEVKL